MAGNKYEEIAAAAIQLFEQKGYHATSVQDIADAVGLQKGSLYHYIASKEELLLKITHQAISGFVRRLEEIIDTDLPVEERFRQGIRTHMQYITQYLSMSTVLLREAFSLGEPHNEVIRDLTDRYLNLWTQIINEGVAAGVFYVKDSRIAALTILGSCNWVYRWFKEEGKYTAEEIADQMADLFLNGLKKGRT
ncbi:TetR/AcrR family transcriptional regulator [Kyrpidia spormannii]|uniref:TetR/AcrR family transcriptional regulator n=1 Tax=Kyrpidia spormannii TaxID=2055160 RepID=A0A2K8N294_9BACL|nr:TetR/AcrR family transcriptional regulator [Kyrpidia spormannii]ATY83664.1 TetR/AcrR family transcriptional regulator [Kyrpidia spormannii]